MAAMIALAGNPNSGKTTLFNALTGSRQHVGNYPGVTVEKKVGVYSREKQRYTIVDLPGTYSLTAYSLEEIVARDFLVDERPSVVIDIVDASNLERNLYLSIQLLEMGIPMCIALNMVDAAELRGIAVDADKLSALLDVPVVPTVARTGRGKEALMASAARLAEKKRTSGVLQISYGHDIDRALFRMVQKIESAGFLMDCYLPRWVALKYMEGDSHMLEAGRSCNPELARELEQAVAAVAEHLEATLQTDPESMIADQRYGFIRSIVNQGVIAHSGKPDRVLFSDRLDRVLTHRFAGPLIMAAVLFAVYQFTFAFGDVPVGWLENGFAWLSARVDAHLADGPLKSLVISALIDGVGGVLGFVPLILFMFFAIAILEDSGYLARVAFMLDRVFQWFGLHGSSVMAYIVSGGIAGGCAVPGVMATRTLKSPKERLATILTIPFMNCGAKLPVFALLVAAFFSSREALMMFVLTLISWGGALLVARLLRSTIIKGTPTPFVMELPPYRMPTVRGVLTHTWERTWQYIRKAGTVILGISILLWAMMTFPGLPPDLQREFDDRRQAAIAAADVAALDANQDTIALEQGVPAAVASDARLQSLERQEAEARLQHSLAGRTGKLLEPLSRWAGFDWRTNIALVGGFAAKEVVVSTLGTAYSMGALEPDQSTPLAMQLTETPGWRPLTALSLILFVMFYSPCFVAVVCISRETGSWKWGFFSMAFNTVLAFLLAVGVFQLGAALGF
ncbi:MAG TPA: ferrous iron transport protein B [Desulfobacterales bacterium]